MLFYKILLCNTLNLNKRRAKVFRLKFFILFFSNYFVEYHLFCIDIPMQSISDVKSRIFSLRSCNLEYIIIIIGHPIHCLGGIK